MFVNIEKEERVLSFEELYPFTRLSKMTSSFRITLKRATTLSIIWSMDTGDQCFIFGKYTDTICHLMSKSFNNKVKKHTWVADCDIISFSKMSVYVYISEMFFSYIDLNIQHRMCLYRNIENVLSGQYFSN